MTYVIAGLGNKGEKYAGTRHNAGRIALSEWVRGQGGTFVASGKHHGQIWSGEVVGKDVLALLPETYMNESGGAVKKTLSQLTPSGSPLGKLGKILGWSSEKSEKKISELIVLYDDIDLPMGTVRVSYNRGSGGHNGIKSVATSLKTEAFVRVRIGVSPVVDGVLRKPKGEDAVLAWVLGDFKKSEAKVFEAACLRVGEIIETIVSEGHEVAMNRFNG